MLQILLLSSVLFAAIAVLYASHRAGHKLFVRISAVFALVSAMILAGLAWELAHPPAPADPAAIIISIDEASELDSLEPIREASKVYGEEEMNAMEAREKDIEEKASV